ncbi:MAG: hypothetical protein OXU23_01765 [Candidatus Poribacteria bacterium]|nr:hypothetical protein [Candidatus Poribacteria bacterium]
MKKVLNKVSENYYKGIKSQILAFLSDSEARRTAEIVSSEVYIVYRTFR